MKKTASIFLTFLVLIMTLLCSCKDNTNEPTSSEEPETPAFDISTVSVADLPTELLNEDLSNWNSINLIAELPDENVMLYGLSVTDDGRGVIFRKDDKIYHYDWAWFTTTAKLPEIASLDINDDDDNEIAISMYVDYNTNVSTEELHIIDFDASGEPVDNCYTAELLKADFESKFDIRYETDEVEETSSESDKDDKDEDEESSKTWLIDHSSDIGKRIIFEQKADDVSGDKKAKKYFTYDATRDVRDNGEYDGITDPHTNIDYTFTKKGKVTAEIRVAARFENSNSVKFICTIDAPITMENGAFVMGKFSYSKA